MDAPFPFGLPLPTAVYLVLYLATLMVHIAFMNYVLAGAAYLAATAPARGGPVTAMLRDWMPFMLSAAITAGIAPLLFLQVLYKEQFYTANLLLFFRWMAILPALIAGFYLAYLLKAGRARRLSVWIGWGVFACFAFVGWAWVENHILSLQPAEEWRAHYVSGAHMYWTPDLMPRLLLWFVAAFPTMTLMVGWQLWDRGDAPASAKPVAWLAVVTIVLTAAWSVRYYFLLSDGAREAVTGSIGRPYLVMSVIGGAVEFAAWIAILRAGAWPRRWLAIASAGLVLNFVGTAVANETTRLAALDGMIGLPTLYARHADSWRVAGLPVFLGFLVVNAGLMALCVRRVRRQSRSL